MNKLFQRINNVLKVLKYYLSGLYHRIEEHNLFLSGAGIAYSLLLSMIPLILLIFSLLGNVFETARLERIINQIIELLLPYKQYADYAKEVISRRLPQVIEYKTLAGYLGLIGLIVTSTWIFSSLRTILNQIFHTKIEKHALIGFLRDIGMVILVVVFISLSTLVFPILNIIVENAQNSNVISYVEIAKVWNIAVWIISLMVMLFLFFLLYYLIPYEQLPKRVALASALSTTLLWELARSLFGYYIRHFLNTNPFYGAFVLFVVILLWIFYSSCIFIAGAEIGQLYRERLNEKTS
jgi:membrane protein